MLYLVVVIYKIGIFLMLRVFFMFFGIVWVIMRGVWFLISFDRRLGGVGI